MQIRTLSATLDQARTPVFNFLADVENLPRWAPEFCERIELRRGRWWAYTSRGELIVALETHAAAGVIDLYAGDGPDLMGVFPIRVLSLSPRRTLVSFTFTQTPEQTDELYEQEYHALRREVLGLIQRFGGGQIHDDPAAALALAGAGVN